MPLPPPPTQRPIPRREAPGPQGRLRWRRVATLLVAGCVVAAAGAWLGLARAADPPAAVRPALTVTTARPQSSSVPLRVAANGSIAAWQEASIGAESSGLRLTEVRVNVGDAVRRGQLLARFATETVEADVAQARAAVVEAEAAAADAAGNAERARTLQNTGALSVQQINQYATAAKTAQARVEAARATLKAQQLRLAHTRVLAPDDGVISARSATVGAVLPGGTELFRLIRGSRLEWRAEVTATELARIRPGIAVQLTTPGGDTLQGRVRMVAPTVDPQTRNAVVYVDLPAHPGARAGMFARGEFAIGSSTAMTIPQQALVAREGFSYVFLVQQLPAGPGAPEGGWRVAQRKVEPGRRIGDRVEIVRGLDANATIAVRGAGFLNEGDRVRVVDEPPAAPAAAPAARQER